MNLGMKIEGDQMEVGFTVGSREEFDATVMRLTTVVGMLWPDFSAPVEQSSAVVAVNPAPGNYAEQRAAANWREAQGLR